MTTTNTTAVKVHDLQVGDTMRDGRGPDVTIERITHPHGTHSSTILWSDGETSHLLGELTVGIVNVARLRSAT